MTAQPTCMSSTKAPLSVLTEAIEAFNPLPPAAVAVAPSPPPTFQCDPSKLEELHRLPELMLGIHDRYAPFFPTQTRTVARHAVDYLHGLFIAKERNMTCISKTVPGANYQGIQHFITDSPWDEGDVIDQLQCDADRLIGDLETASLHVDGSGFLKSGHASVGVKDQYCGVIGGVDNCQVGVYLGLTNGRDRILIDKRLSLPREWADDPDRRTKCGVPDNVVYRTRPEHAWEMIREAKRRGVRFGWIGMDIEFGQNIKLLHRIEEGGMVYVADVKSERKVWTEPPRTGIFPRHPGPGRPPTRVRVLKGEPASVQARELADTLPTTSWRRVLMRDAERGELWADICCLRVHPVHDRVPDDEVWLIIRKDLGNEKDVKYQLSNAPKDTSIDRLARMSCSRYWIERAIQDAKGEVGMDEYQVRGWPAWNHHMTMVMLATLVLLELRLEMKDEQHPFTIQDVCDLLESALPRRIFTLEEAYEEVVAKIRARMSARWSHHRRSSMGMIGA